MVILLGANAIDLQIIEKIILVELFIYCYIQKEILRSTFKSRINSKNCIKVVQCVLTVGKKESKEHSVAF